MKIYAIDLCFENCEIIRILNSDLLGFYMSGITEGIYRGYHGDCSKFKIADKFALKIKKGADTAHYTFGMREDETTIFDRVSWGDIVNVNVYWEVSPDAISNIPDDIEVQWNEENEYRNSYQKSRIDNEGNLCIEVSKEPDFTFFR